MLGIRRITHIPLLPTLLSIVVVCLTGYFWYLKYQLAGIRYFDHDEFSYLYWARHMVDGSMPYRDFLLYPAPGLLWLLEPIVSVFHGFSAFIAARMMMVGIFFFLALLASALFWEMRKSWTVVFIPLLLVFLPLPSDKFIEIRPDTLAVLSALIGVWIQIRYMNRASHTTSGIASLAGSGVFFGLSLLVSQKMVTLVVIALCGFIGWSYMRVQKRISTSHGSWIDILSLLSGIAIIGVLALGWFLTIGNFSLIWYSLVTLPFEANKLGAMYPIPADFFFRQNDVVYGTGGYHVGYWLSLILWITGILIGIFRFMTTVTFQDTKTMWQEAIISAYFIVSVILYIYVMPMKHPQYLIPIAVFIVWYVVDGVNLLWKEYGTTRIHRVFLALLVAAFFYFMFVGYRLVNEPKTHWNYDQERIELGILLRTIPKTEYLLDFECISLYYPSPYYITCMPAGQITPLMSLVIPTVRERLEKTNTRYIYQGKSYRTRELLPEDQLYIVEHFTPIGNGALLVRNDTVETYLQQAAQ